MELQKKINTKIVEHETEIQGALNKMLEQQKIVAEIQAKGTTPHNMLVESSKLALIKDKILFHKAGVAVLKDLLDEL